MRQDPYDATKVALDEVSGNVRGGRPTEATVEQAQKFKDLVEGRTKTGASSTSAGSSQDKNRPETLLPREDEDEQQELPARPADVDEPPPTALVRPTTAPLAPTTFRKNLRCTVSQTEDREKIQALANLLTDRFEVGRVIVYVWMKKTVNEVARLLASRGVNCRGYHGSLSAEERDKIQQDFSKGHVRVLISTTAFGMGVDIPDVRAIVHYDLPKSMENFVQESGRCARGDFEKLGYCHVFVNDGDFTRQRKMVFGSIGAHGHAVDKLLSQIFGGKRRRHLLLRSGEDGGEGMVEGILAGEQEAGGYSVLLPTKDTCNKLGCEEDEIHSLLATLERLSNNAFVLYSRFPGRIKLRFYDTPPQEIAETDIFLRQLLPLCRQNSGVYTFDTVQTLKQLCAEATASAAVAASAAASSEKTTTKKSPKPILNVAASPSDFLTNLNVAANLHKFAIDREQYGYLVQVLGDPEDDLVEGWAAALKSHAREAEQVSAQQIDACFCAFMKVAELGPQTVVQASRQVPAEQANILNAQTTALREKIEIYFSAGEGEDVVSQICGGGESGEREKRNIVGTALDVAPDLLKRLEKVDQESSEKIWRSHPRFKELTGDIERHCRTTAIWQSLRESKEPALLMTNVLLGRCVHLLGPDWDARNRWMKNAIWKIYEERPFAMVLDVESFFLIFRLCPLFRDRGFYKTRC